MDIIGIPVVIARAPPPFGFGGPFRITVPVDELGVPGRYRVRLCVRTTGQCVGERWSNSSGIAEFSGIAMIDRGYYAVAFDHGTEPLNAAIADFITPEAMG